VAVHSTIRIVRAGVPVAVVSAAMAARFWPGQDAVGKRIRIARSGTPWITVVGVAGNVDDSHDPGVPLETWYLPFAQHAGSPAAAHVYLMVRARPGDPLAIVPEVQQALWRVDKTLAPYGITAMDAYRSASIARERLGRRSCSACPRSVLAPRGARCLRCDGRSAPHSEPPKSGSAWHWEAVRATSFRSVLRRGLILVTVGVGVGLVAAVALNRVLASVLTQVGSLNIPVLASAALLIVAAAACRVRAARRQGGAARSARRVEERMSGPVRQERFAFRCSAALSGPRRSRG
jgi:hypothetical protein